tara:strand:- start:3000 stop:5084 length:2085 start_codon:yes stop_codon:yes gene_type:complete
MKDFNAFIGLAYKNFDFESFSDKSWEWLVERMRGATVHICCQETPEEENPDHVYIYLNRKHRNGKAFRWYINGLTPDLVEISKGIDADVYAIPAIAKDPKFIESVLQKQEYAYLNHFRLLAKSYPTLEKHYKREVKELPNSGIAAMLLCNLLPIEKCIVHGLDLYYPHYRDYEANPQGKKPPHNEDFDLACLDLVDKNKFKVESKNPKVLQKFEKKKLPSLPRDASKRRDALLLVTDDGFAVPTTFFIHNFIEKNSWFSGDVVIIHSDNIAPLSHESMDLIKTSGYQHIKFRKIEPSRETYISEVISGFSSKKGYHSRILPSVFTVEAYNHEMWADEYDKTCLLDPDMLVIDSLEDVFNIDVPVMVTEDTTFVDPSKDPARNGVKQFNGGFVMADHRKLVKCGVNVSNAIFEFCRHYKTAPKLFEQSIMNDFFEAARKVRMISKIPFDITFAPDRTQMLKRCVPDSAKHHFVPAGRILENSYERSYNNHLCKIIHYVGSKPWQYSNKTHEEAYQKVEKLWFVAFEQFYSSCSKFAKSKILAAFIKNNPRISRTLKGNLQYRPADSVNRVTSLKREDIIKLLQKEGNYEKGFSLYNQAKTQHPAWPALKREFGFFLLRQNRPKDIKVAFDLFAEAVKANPKSSAAAGGAALCAIKLKDRKNAYNYLKKVQRLSPATKTSKQIEAQFVDAFAAKTK